MAYSVKQLAKLAHISVRTLHYYDEVGLLRPAEVKSNGYRVYEEKELLRLQQILFFKELELPLEEIKRILDASGFNIVSALNDHKKLIEIKRKRLDGLLITINKTIKKMTHDKKIKDEELFGDLDKEKLEEYQKEAKERWGNTEVWKQSQERYGKMSKEDLAKIQKENGEILQGIADNMDKGVKSPVVQTLIAKHYNALRHWYEPNLEMYRGLADMYVADERFAAFYKKIHSDLPEFMRDAMHYFADHQ